MLRHRRQIASMRELRLADKASKRRFFILVLLLLVTLACATNTPVASVATPRPTRTPVPTFTVTHTPLPPTSSPTATDTPIPTDTPIVTDTPIPTDTPVPTETPIPPTNAPPPPTAAPPTNTPEPSPTFTAVAESALPTPTFTPEPGTPAGHYEAVKEEGEQNCAHIGVTGRVLDEDDDPVQWVTIQVKGDDDDFRGPYIGKTDADGYYSILITELTEDVDRVEFEAEVIGGPNVKADDTPDWEVRSNCSNKNATQVRRIDWRREID
jgi:hypothetical protein